MDSQFEPQKAWVPPGHFYSPIPSLEEVKRDEDRIFVRDVEKMPLDIDFNIDLQMNFLEKFEANYSKLPLYGPDKKSDLRYYFENSAFSYFDAISLYNMIMIAKPKRIIEVGSGYSSCVTLDVNELFFDNKIKCTFIEPYPKLLVSLLKEEDLSNIELIGERLQTVSLDKFTVLEAGDILFIDSTHVSKTGSDVNYVIFDILPRLKSGVYIHFHDVFYPFEYPQEWVYEGRAWNEDYMLRAFLQNNSNFEIVFFNHFMSMFCKNEITKKMPLCLKNPGGSLWLRKKKVGIE